MTKEKMKKMKMFFDPGEVAPSLVLVGLGVDDLDLQGLHQWLLLFLGDRH